MMPILTCLLSLQQALAAEPVFVPELSYQEADDFGITVMLDGSMHDELLRDGQMVLTGPVVAAAVGQGMVAGCGARPDCPQQVLSRIPAQLAVVGLVRRVGPTLVVHVEVHSQRVGGPVEVRDIPVAPGSEHLFGPEVAAMVRAAVLRTPPSSDAVLLAAARLIGGETQHLTPEVTGGAPAAVAPAPQSAPPKVMPVIVDLDTPEGAKPPRPPRPERPAPAPRPPSADPAAQPEAETDAALKLPEGVAPRHLMGSEGQYERSGMDARDWLYRATPHAGRVTFEVRAGLGMGDVDRFADVRAALENGVQTQAWYQEGPSYARRPRGEIFLGYAPLTFLDVGVLVGLQYSGRDLTTGLARAAEGEGGATGAAPVEVSDLDDIQAVQFHLQPRVRGYLVPTGPAKPYLVTGIEVKVFDTYRIEQPAGVSYPIPPGGSTAGWVGGAGLLIDPSPIMGLFFEGAYIPHFGLRSRTTTEGLWAGAIPTPQEARGWTASLMGGVQFRL